MRTAVDSNILMALRQPSGQLPIEVFAKVAAQGPVCICPVAYAETGSRFSSKEELDRFLTDIRVEFEPFTTGAAFQAGQIFREYLRSGGKRDRVLADFLIGAHAMLQAGQLLTRDRGFYRKYFRGLAVVEP